MIAIKDMKKPNSCAECKFCIKQKRTSLYTIMLKKW